MAREKIIEFPLLKRLQHDGNINAAPSNPSAAKSGTIHDLAKSILSRHGRVDGIYRQAEGGGFTFFTYDGFAERIREKLAQREQERLRRQVRLLKWRRAERSFFRRLARLFLPARRLKHRLSKLTFPPRPPTAFVMGMLQSEIIQELAGDGYPLPRIFIELRNTGRISAAQHRDLMNGYREAVQAMERLERLRISFKGLGRAKS